MGIIGFKINSKEVFKNVFLSIISQFLIKTKGIIILPIMVHFIAKEDFGIMGVIGMYGGILLPIVTLNLFDGSGMFFSSDFELNSVSQKFKTVMISSLTLSIPIYLLAFIILKNYESTSPWVYYIIISLFIQHLYKSSVFIFQSYQKATRLVIYNVILGYGSATLSIIFIYTGIITGFKCIYYGSNSIYLIMAIFNLVFILKEFNLRATFRKDFLLKIIPISLPLIPVYLTENLFRSSGVFFLKMFTDMEQIGNYSIVMRLTSLFLVLRSTLQYFWYSTTSRLIQNESPDKFRYFSNIVFKNFFSLIVLGLIFFTIFIQDLVLLLTNKSYMVTSIPCIIVCYGYGFLIFSSLYNGVLYAMAKTKTIFYSNVIGAVVTFISAYFFVKYAGLIGAALAMTFGNFVLFIFMVIFFKKELPDKFHFKFENGFKHFIISLLFIVFSILSHIYFISHSNPWILRSLGIIYICCYIYICYRLNCISLKQIINGVKSNLLKIRG